ncbi:MAG TPA: PAS domain-containing sensor histidine kinase [Candidatus Paceibacterota bacterium]|nr:PAS domain-containing sensor histidine kinase [Candidatus Paceibacterota bacterium]
MKPAVASPEFEKKLQRASLFRNGYLNFPHHVVITDADGFILAANPAAERVTGYTEAEMIGRKPGELWGGYMPREFYQQLWHRISVERMPFVGRVTNARKDGTKITQEITVSPVIGDDGEIEFFIAIEPEISNPERKKQFDEDITGVVSHQLRTPLSAINWALEYVMEEGGLKPDQVELLKGAYEQSRSASVLISDILIASRLGMEKLDLAETDIGRMIQDIVLQMRRLFPAVRYECAVCEPSITVQSNPTLARQVFSNLIENAFKYADPAGGKVVLGLERVDGGFRFSSENNGNPVPAEEMPKLFHKYFRGEYAKSVGKGTGLGLYIVRTICDEFGWRIDVMSPSETLGGTKFVLSA